MFTQCCSKYIQETAYQISSRSPDFYKKYYKNILFFSGHIVHVRYSYTVHATVPKMS